METRIDMAKAYPNAYKALLNLSAYLGDTDLTKTHTNLIKIRASQINGCAFCIDMHTKEARKAGETEQRIYTLSVWHDTTFFTEAEQAILALTESVTLISSHVSDDVYNNAVKQLGEKYTADVLMAIIIINSWNRLAITTKMMPPAN